jgi:1-hydroxycarotenoid 3,4-desaturase
VTDAADVVIVGAGIAGLTAAVELGAAGLSVRVIEASLGVGGKAGVRTIDGVEVDTGPSVLTLPWVFDEVFARAGLSFQEEVELLQPDPAFRYVFDDGVELVLHHDLEQSFAEIRGTFGSDAERQFRAYLERARAVWEAAAPHFVFAPAPRWSRLARLGPGEWARLLRIDALSTLERGIDKRVREPHLRDLLRRFATYSGSDVRKAPGTLACVAHVELGLGGFGVRGGIHALGLALERAARAVGVEFELGRRVLEIEARSGRVDAIRCDDGRVVRCTHVVLNADANNLRGGAFGPSLVKTRLGPVTEPSMSAYTGIIRARRRPRTAHAVLFPQNYLQEFVDIFDAGQVPARPAIYLCALEVAHARRGWADEEPLFVMINAPAVSALRQEVASGVVREQVLCRLRERGLVASADDFVWWRTPADLAREFPGSHGAIYGSALHGSRAAFNRPDNEPAGVGGLYLASGSAHPGGGVPLVAQSGKQAARAILERRRLSA